MVPSNNHASPNGALPFLLPAYSESESKKNNVPVASNKLRKYAEENGRIPRETDSLKYAPYKSLLDDHIRKAWLYTLYLSPENSHIPLRLYIKPSSSSYFARNSLTNILNKAAKSELVSTTSTNGSSLSIFGGKTPEFDVRMIYKEATEAFEALNILLGNDEWFFGQNEPGEFDASVFAYTHLLLDEGMDWRDTRLKEVVEGCGNLVGHRARIWERCYEMVYE